jgi:hypothetical protein
MSHNEAKKRVRSQCKIPDIIRLLEIFLRGKQIIRQIILRNNYIIFLLN